MNTHHLIVPIAGIIIESVPLFFMLRTGITMIRERRLS
jgi:hypothetical protein